MAKASTKTETQPTREPRRRNLARKHVTILGNAKAEEGSVEAVIRSYIEQKAEPDAFDSQYVHSATEKQIIKPPYNLNALARLIDENAFLSQCVEAMVTNIFGHGYRWDHLAGDDGKRGTAKPKSRKAKNELLTLQQIVDCPNGDTSWQEVIDAAETDYEVTGNAYLEIGRDQQSRVTMISHISSPSVRLTSRDKDSVEITVQMMRGNKIVSQKVKKRFRRYVQLVGNKRIYFKEIGDPRKIDPKTGDVNDALSVEESATEVYHHHRYNPRSQYGVPRWLSQLPAVLGSRQSELTNLDFFNDNAIPAMAISVAGGDLSQDTIDHIEEKFTSVRGRKAANRVVVIEALGDSSSAGIDGRINPPKIEIKALTDERQKDGLFLDYKKDCGESIRSSFRLPPLFIGLSTDVSYATAKTSFEIAESQIFGPERWRWDQFFNLVVFASWSPEYWFYRSLPARITNSDDIVNAIEKFENSGGLTPNISIQLANEYFGLDLQEIEEPWGNYPFEIVRVLAAQGKLKGIDAILDLEGQVQGLTDDKKPAGENKDVADIDGEVGGTKKNKVDRIEE